MSGRPIVLVHLLCALALAVLAIGSTASVASAAPAAAVSAHTLADEPVDSDFDGIPDARDSCPDVSGVPENYGCPYVGPVDSDGDGVTDDVDKCVDKAGPADNDGCPLVAVKPAAVVLDDRCGTSDDTATVPRTTGVVYYYAGRPAAAGRYVVKGTIKVEARAARGYELTGTKTWSETFSVTACRVGKLLVTSPGKGLVRVVNQENFELTITSGRVSGRVGPKRTVTFGAPAGTYTWTATWAADLSPARGRVCIR